MNMGEKGTGGRHTGDKKRGDGKRDSQGVGKQEKQGKIMQHCAIFCNCKSAKKQELTKVGQKLGLKGTGSGKFKPPPCFPHPSPHT